jgi:hypothetical protein
VEASERSNKTSNILTSVVLRVIRAYDTKVIDGQCVVLGLGKKACAMPANGPTYLVVKRVVEGG